MNHFVIPNLEHLLHLLCSTLPMEDTWARVTEPLVFDRGSYHQRDRIASVAEFCVAKFPGDIVEIGCFQGATTRRLLEVAKRHGRRVLAVDPWEFGTQNCKGDEYEQFLRNTEPYHEHLDIERVSSLEPRAIKLIQERQLAFAFVDGLHTYQACLQDIHTVQHCAGLIAVDDTSWSEEVRIACLQRAIELRKQVFALPGLRESYLL